VNLKAGRLGSRVYGILINEFRGHKLPCTPKTSSDYQNVDEKKRCSQFEYNWVDRLILHDPSL